MRGFILTIGFWLVASAASAQVIPGKPATLYVEHAGAVVAVEAVEQQIPQPSGPVLFCGRQAAPAAESWTVSVDGAAPVALAMDATLDAECPTDQGFTHSFTLPATLFPVGNHVVVVWSANAFGVTVGDEYQVIVGIAPGKFTIGYVKAKQG